MRGAVCAYNHADWYVDSVLLRAQVIGGMPTSLVSSLTGLTEGRFPVAAKAMYADEVDARHPRRRRPTTVVGNANRNGVSIYADAGSPVVAVSDVAGDQDRRLQAPRPLHPGPGRVRQHVHVRAPGQDLPALRRAEAAEGGPGRGQAPAGAAEAQGREAEARRVGARTGPATRRRPPSRRRPTRPVATDSETAAPVVQAAVKERLFAQPDARERDGRRWRPAGVPAHRPHRRRAHPGPRARPRARPDRHQEAQGGLAGPRRHRARPHRHGVLEEAPARALRDPPGRPRRPAHRPEADPRRLEAARVDGDLPRARARTRSSAPTPRRRRSARSC